MLGQLSLEFKEEISKTLTTVLGRPDSNLRFGYPNPKLRFGFESEI